MKKAIPIYQADAFTSTLFGGNPAAVCPLETWLPDDVMQAIGNENNLAETAFFVPLADGSFQLRWFTPTIEVDLCGHATLATAHILFTQLGYLEDTIRFQTRSGELRVTKEETGYAMQLPADNLELVSTPSAIANSIPNTVIETWKGKFDYLAVLESQKAIEELKPNFHLLATLPVRGIIFTAPGEETDFVSRCFFPASGIDEDPVTGSAHASLLAYWSPKLGKTRMRAIQLSARKGWLDCELHETAITLRGNAVTYLQGVIYI